jgi:type IV pilus assembly protein PilV
VSLLEALIAVLVMSVGLLGMATLLFIGIQENASALRQSQANQYAYDMADRIRANLSPPPPADLTDRTDVADHYGTGDDAIDVDADSDPTGQTCGNGESCNPDQMRDFDADQWRAMVIGLPGGQGTVDEIGGDTGRYVIRVLWDDDPAGIPADDPRNTRGCPSAPDPDDAGYIDKSCVELWVEP